MSVKLDILHPYQLYITAEEFSILSDRVTSHREPVRRCDIHYTMEPCLVMNESHFIPIRVNLGASNGHQSGREISKQ